jgi:hypothetical protein
LISRKRRERDQRTNQAKTSWTTWNSKLTHSLFNLFNINLFCIEITRGSLSWTTMRRMDSMTRTSKSLTTRIE